MQQISLKQSFDQLNLELENFPKQITAFLIAEPIKIENDYSSDLDLKPQNVSRILI